MTTKPVCVLAIGMAGSGKTTLVQRLVAHLNSNDTPPYVLNLDPAVAKVPYEANIDIRDTVNYKEVMKQYNLGPNGGILTALNLFTTKFDQVLSFVEKRAATGNHAHVLVDTPGQIEIFTWSASGAIITDAFASSLPTVVAYVVDTARTKSPQTFMSNMLYACSILYKTRLPLILVFNKTDITPHQFALEWMRDFETFQEAMSARSATNSGDGGGYMDSLLNSMSLMLEEFYRHLRAVGVSALTGDGMEEFFDAVEQARQEYETEYRPELEKVQAERAKKKEEAKADSLERLMKDLKTDGHTSAAGPSRATGKQPADDDADAEDEDSGPSGDELDRTDLAEERHFHDIARDRGVRMRRGNGVVEDDLGGRWPDPGGASI